MFDFSKMSMKELDELKKALAVEIEVRETNRKKELAVDLIRAAKALRMEYPWASMMVEICSPDEEEFDIDLLDYLIEMRPEDVN